MTANKTMWLEKKLGDILSLIRNGSSNSQVGYPTRYPVTRIETIANGSVDYSRVGYVENINNSYILKTGDVLLSNINSVKHIGKVAYYYEKDGILYHGMNLLILRVANDFDNKFVYYYLIFKKTWFEQMCSLAVNQASINQNTIKALSLYLPALKKEQSKIAEILSTVDGAIDKTDNLIEKYKRIKEGLMQDLFRYGIDENGQIRSEKTHKFKDSPLGRCPIEWEVKPLSEFQLDIIDGDRGDNYPKESELMNDGYCVFLNNKNIENGKFVFNTIQFISKEKDCLLRKGRVNIDDIVVTTRGTVGNIALYTDEYVFKKMRINSGMIILRNYKDFIGSFLNMFWAFSFGKQYCVIRSGSAQPQLPIRDLKYFYLVKPEINEQKRIIEIIKSLDDKIANEEVFLQKYLLLKHGLMDDLLTGKVRVTGLLN